MNPARIGKNRPAALDAPFVALRWSGDAAQRHVGVVYYSEESRQLWELDLAWHYDVRRARYADDGRWVHILPTDPLDRAVLRTFIGLCERVAKQYARPQLGIPYGTRYDGAVFDLLDGCYSPAGARESGLTCATFVLALFESCAWPLVARVTWPDSRPEDAPWREHVASLLERRDPAQAARVRAERECARYHPLEVAGAALWSPPAVPFESARLGADHLEAIDVDAP